MSYILNALRKSQQQRPVDEAEKLENTLLTQNEPAANNKWLWWGVLIVLLNALILLAIFFKQQPVATHQTVPPRKSVSPGTQEKTSVPVVKKVQQQPLLQLAPNKRITSHVTPPDSDSIAQMLASQKKTAVADKPSISESVQQAEAAQIATSEENTPPITEQEAATHLQTVTPKPDTPQKIAIVETTADDYPLLDELDYEFRRKVPKLQVNVYVYSEYADERFIMNKMQRFTEGQDIADNLNLLEIRKDHLLVRFEEKTFLIKRP